MFDWLIVILLLVSLTPTELCSLGIWLGYTEYPTSFHEIYSHVQYKVDVLYIVQNSSVYFLENCILMYCMYYGTKTKVNSLAIQLLFSINRICISFFTQNILFSPILIRHILNLNEMWSTVLSYLVIC